MTGRWWAGVTGGLATGGRRQSRWSARRLVGQVQASLTPGRFPPLFDYWRSSRVIPFTINEFPYWSFLYADLHAHLIDLPIVVLIVGAWRPRCWRGATRSSGRTGARRCQHWRRLRWRSARHGV